MKGKVAERGGRISIGRKRIGLSWQFFLALVIIFLSHVFPIMAEDKKLALQLRPVLTVTNDFPITIVAWHPDGRHLAVAQVLDKRIAIWDIQTGKRVRMLDKEAGGVHTLAYSPNGKYLAVGRGFVRRTKERAHVHIYDASSGDRVLSLPGDAGASFDPTDAEALAFSPDSRYLAASGHGSNGAAVVYDIVAKKLLSHTPSVTRGAGTIEALAFSPDSRFLVLGRNIGTTEIWSTAPWKLFKRFEGPTGGVHALAFSPDGKRLVLGTNIGERWDRSSKPSRALSGKFNDDLVVLSVPEFEKIAEYSSNHRRGIIENIDFTPDGKFLLVSARAASIEIVATSALKNAFFKGGLGVVVEAALSPNGKYVAMGMERKVEIYEINRASSSARIRERRGDDGGHDSSFMPAARSTP